MKGKCLVELLLLLGVFLLLAIAALLLPRPFTLSYERLFLLLKYLFGRKASGIGHGHWRDLLERRGRW